MDKKDLRKYFMLNRERMSKQEVKDRSAIIAKRFFMLAEYKNCKKIFIYLNFKNEVETVSLIEKALEDKKQVALPWVDDNYMYFIEIKSLNNLVLSKFGIFEPIFKKENIVISDLETLCIVPGLAFDRHNYRLGYGKGYYDKYFESNIFMKKIGICYDFQIVDVLKIDKYDIHVDFVISDNYSC